MGLDQYMYKLKGNITPNEYEQQLEKITQENGLWTDESDKLIEELQNSLQFKEIAYWRKYYELDDYMQDLYSEVSEGVFNCKYLELDADTIAHLIDLFTDEYTVKVMQQALEYINKGYRIWYSNWW